MQPRKNLAIPKYELFVVVNQQKRRVARDLRLVNVYVMSLEWLKKMDEQWMQCVTILTLLRPCTTQPFVYKINENINGTFHSLA